MSLTSLSSLSDAEEDNNNPNRVRRIPDREDIFSKYDGEEFRVRYRVSKEVAIQISDMLDLEPLTHRNKAVDGITQLLICLRFFATGAFQQVMGDIVNVHKSTVCRVVQRVSKKFAICNARQGRVEESGRRIL
ncbi:unnamed protein product [Plutella xylostella]|uniref:(diamondback moth) hypothetical protein n=1 Tax=Plutella xylostella TaxID=51655 RepID=A0A8S4FMU2_PLUXY|nr:unnamed protein product [Plutella xylostella]